MIGDRSRKSADSRTCTTKYQIFPTSAANQQIRLNRKILRTRIIDLLVYLIGRKLKTTIRDSDRRCSRRGYAKIMTDGAGRASSEGNIACAKRIRIIQTCHIDRTRLCAVVMGESQWSGKGIREAIQGQCHCSLPPVSNTDASVSGDIRIHRETGIIVADGNLATIIERNGPAGDVRAVGIKNAVRVKGHRVVIQGICPKIHTALVDNDAASESVSSHESNTARPVFDQSHGLTAIIDNIGTDFRSIAQSRASHTDGQLLSGIELVKNKIRGRGAISRSDTAAGDIEIIIRPSDEQTSTRKSQKISRSNRKG